MVNYNRPRSWFEVECVVNSVLVGNITKLLSFNSTQSEKLIVFQCYLSLSLVNVLLKERQLKENAVTNQISSHAKDSFVFTVH